MENIVKLVVCNLFLLKNLYLDRSNAWENTIIFNLLQKIAIASTDQTALYMTTYCVIRNGPLTLYRSR